MGHKAQLWGWLKTVLVPVLGSDQEGVCRTIICGIIMAGEGGAKKKKKKLRYHKKHI